MTLAIETNRDLNIGLGCVLDMVMDYATQAESYRAYLLAKAAAASATFKDLNIFVSGLWLPHDIQTAGQLVEHVECLSGMIEVGIKHYRDVNAGKANTITTIHKQV